MKKIIVTVGAKGGIGKSVVSIFSALRIAELGYKTLLIDLDGHHFSTSSHFISDYSISEKHSIYRVLKEQILAKESIVNINDNLKLVPACDNLKEIDLEISGAENIFLLKDLYDDLIDEFDFVIIDTPPQLSRATELGLTIATDIIIPTQLEKWAYRAVSMTLDKVYKIKKHLNPNLKNITILPTFYKKDTLVTQNLENDLKTSEFSKYFSENIFISRRQEIVNACFLGDGEGLTKASKSYKEFDRLVEKVINE